MTKANSGGPGAAFAYRDGALHVEDVPLARIAAEVGTPFYCYSSTALRNGYRAFADAFAGMDATICYALKANATLAVVRTFAAEGAGADVVSEGELRIARAAGIAPGKIVFSGIGKTRAEMAAALQAGILQINVESEPELVALGEVARGLNKRIAVALRVNPDVDARTHAKITTGKKENKFGIPIGDARRLYAQGAAMPGLLMRGVAVHIGSQITDLSPYRKAFARVVELVRRLRADGHDIRRLDLGGGLGIAYRKEKPPSIAAYAALVKQAIAGLDVALTFEPGRFLVGNGGVLVTRVLYVKAGAAHRFLIVDAGMNDLIRPALYDAYHEILPLKAPAKGAQRKAFEVVGPVCESADAFAHGRLLPPVAAGEFLAICSAGAYASVMSSTYNARLPAAEVMARGGHFAVVRPRPDYDDLLGRDLLPDWLGPPGNRTASGNPPDRQ